MNKLWTRDFTIITLGTVVSMLGNAVSGFAVGLLVLDYTNSVILYAIAIVVCGLPKVVLPILSGPFLDRFSRKKVIYLLDFTSAAVYLLLFAVLKFNLFSYPLLLCFSLVIGSIDGVYTVAYESLYPSLITEGNYSRAYSVSSMIYPLAAMMMPIASIVYKNIGVEPLFLFNAAAFFIAASVETRIKGGDTHLTPVRTAIGLRQFSADFKEGLQYIKNEPGLIIITVYFFITMFCGSSVDVLALPFFKRTPGLGELTYSLVMGAGVFGRLIGGFIHYKFRYPAEKKFFIACTVYMAICVLNGGFMLTPVWFMLICTFCEGIMGVTSYSIRISSTQSYVPDSKRGRFNGVFQMVTVGGSTLGQLAAGGLGELAGEQLTVLIFMSVNLIGVFAVMLPGRNAVKKIYNRDI